MVDWLFARYPDAIKDDLASALAYFYTDWPQDENHELNRRKAVEVSNLFTLLYWCIFIWVPSAL